MAFCIPEDILNNFKKDMSEKKITPDMLIDMEPAQRHGYFAQTLGAENAHKVNALFESKLILKNQKQGIITWGQKILGMRPEAKRDFLSRVNRMEKALTPTELNGFLEDLAEQKLGMNVTESEAGNIVVLAKAALDARIVLEDKYASGKSPTFKEKMDYGYSSNAFEDYVNDLRDEAKHIPLSDYLNYRNTGTLIIKGAGFAKAMKASLDNSVIGRQGIKVLFTNPSIWLKNSMQSFKDWGDAFVGKDVMGAVRADVKSRENAINGAYKKAKLDVGVTEESIPTHAPAHIPLIGRFFRASEAAFTAWQYRTRADLFDKYNEVIESAGGNTDGLGDVVNSLTGRGHLGKLEVASQLVNNVFFSPRFLRSNIDALTGHAFSQGLSKEVRLLAAFNTMKMIGSMAIILAAAKAIDPESVELDPESTDFGKIKVGNTRFDISGGMSGVAVLAARLLPVYSDENGLEWYRKSSVTGIKTKLNTGDFNAPTIADEFMNFAGNKLSPAASMIKNMATGRTFSGEKPTYVGELVNLLAPIPLTNYVELKDDPNSANIIASTIADLLGIGTNTYSAKADWSANPGSQMEAFKEKVGEKEFRLSNDDFNRRYNIWLDGAKKDADVMRLSDEDKKKAITRETRRIKLDIYREHGFYPTNSKSALPEIKRSFK